MSLLMADLNVRDVLVRFGVACSLPVSGQSGIRRGVVAGIQAQPRARLELCGSFRRGWQPFAGGIEQKQRYLLTYFFVVVSYTGL